ncbi:SLAM family member 8-like isoform 2-T2 [Hipposideros larvatus]
MGPCCEDPHLHWASWLLGLAELAGVLLAIGQGKTPRGLYYGGRNQACFRWRVRLQELLGSWRLWHWAPEFWRCGFQSPRLSEEGPRRLRVVSRDLGDGRRLRSSAGGHDVGLWPRTNYRVLLRVVSGGDLPTWVSLQDKYRHRVHVPNMRSLLIANLTPEDSGQYQARASFSGGREFTQVFQLTVCEPVPLPQILAKSLSVTADWCNVTLECRAVGASEDLNVTWWHSDLPRKWQQTGTLGPGSSIWPLAVRLPLDQANTSLSCNASNEVDLKTATTTLGDICAHYPQGQDSGHHLPGLTRPVMAALLIVGVGLYLWKTRGKKKEEMETGTGAGLEEGRRVHEDDIHYVELRKQEPEEGGDTGVRGQHLEGKSPVTTLYSEVHRPGRAVQVI